MPEMFTVVGKARWPTIEMMSPTPLRISSAGSAICPVVAFERFGWTTTRSAPAPLMSMLLLETVTPLEAWAPLPST